MLRFSERNNFMVQKNPTKIWDVDVNNIDFNWIFR